MRTLFLAALFAAGIASLSAIHGEAAVVTRVTFADDSTASAPRPPISVWFCRALWSLSSDLSLPSTVPPAKAMRQCVAPCRYCEADRRDPN